jgi:hypothetical protein
VRRGACWTAAYHLQLTVAAVARPVGSSVVPSESLLLSGPGLLLAQPASARRSVQPPSSGGASSPWSTLRRRQPWHRSVSSIGCSPIRGRRPGSGGPAVQCPARPVSGHLGLSSRVWRSGRLVSTRPASSSLVSSRPMSSRPVSSPVWCPPRRSGRVHLLPQRAVALGSRPVQRGTRHHRNRSRSRWATAPSSGSVNGQQAWRAGGAAEVARWLVGGRWRPGRIGCGRPGVPAERLGRPSRRAERR